MNARRSVLPHPAVRSGYHAACEWTKGGTMSVAKIIEISAESPNSFEDAIREGIKRASKTIKNIKSAWVEDQLVEVEDAKVVSFRVHMKVTFVLD
jgi:dodecin